MGGDAAGGTSATEDAVAEDQGSLPFAGIGWAGRSKRRILIYFATAIVAAVILLVALHDLTLYRYDALPAEYCMVTVESAASRPGIAPGELTTREADSGCIDGEQHLCGYHRFVLSDVIEVRPQPC